MRHDETLRDATTSEAMDAEIKARRSRRSRRKGKDAERELVDELQKLGLCARRVPLSGSMAATGFGGDVLVEDACAANCRIPSEHHHAEERWEVKRRGRAWVQLQRWLQDAAVVAFRSDRGEWMVCMRLADYARDRLG